MSDLREFVDKVQELGELRVIEGANWDIEIGAASMLAAAAPNPPAILFDKIKDYKPGYRVLATHCTTNKRIALILGLPLPSSRQELVRKLRDKLSEPLKLVPPVEVKKGPIMQNIHTGSEVDLFSFPVPKWLPGDGGRYIGTGVGVIMKDPEEGWHNIGCYRVQVHDRSTATIHFSTGKHGDVIRKKYWERGQNCPVVVTCGGEPLLVEIAAMRIPWGVSEYDYAGWWRGEPVQVIKGPTTGLPIPASAEIALEGELVPPEVETKEEGPFSEYTGHYTPTRPAAAFKVKCILHRNDPIILGILPFLGVGVVSEVWSITRSSLLWSALDKIVPGVRGVCGFREFGDRALVISIEQQYGGHAKQAALAAIGQLSYDLKYVIVVDDDVDPFNLREVLWALAWRANPEEVDLIRSSWCSSIDPLLSPQKRQAGDFTHTAAVILACKPYHLKKDFPPSIEISSEIQRKVQEKWGDLLFRESQAK